jgi:putative tricarboxylic transport membrane protein
MPGGIGALAFNYNINQKTHDPQVITAASTGSLLNIALNKFGGYSDRDVRWLGALGTDFGVIAVRIDSTINTLEEMVGALKIDSQSLVFGVAGSIGSQDWMKAALILDVGGLDPLSVRYISYEGGGEAVNSLLKGHIDVFTGELAEIASFVDSGQIKVLAVLAEKRLEGVYASISTAREQGFDVVWPVWRGYYLPPGIKDDEYRWWVNTLRRLSTTREFQAHRRKLQLFPFSLFGDKFDIYVRDNVDQMREIARKFNLIK